MKKKKGYKKAKFNGGVSMSLYELNQNIIAQLPPITKAKRNKILNEINDLYGDEKYCMLLCNELHYYTVFHYHCEIDNEFLTLGDAVLTIIDEMDAKIISADKIEDHYEIWLRTQNGEEKNNNVFLLFPYNYGVIQYG